MNILLTAQNLSKSFGSQTLFEAISFSLFSTERVGLLGPNGAGKSTLLKILAGIESADAGHIAKRQGLKIGYCPQSPHFSEMTVEQVVMEACNSDMQKLKGLSLLDRAQFKDLNIKSCTLSGGWKKRLDIVRVLAQEPDLVLLDEPTNHLDLEGIFWLERFLEKERTTFLVVSHDRLFLQNFCKKIIELNSCYSDGIFSCDGDLETFYKRKEQLLQSQLEELRSLKNTLRTEVEWMRRSPQARTTKSRSRMDRAESMIEQMQALQKRVHQQKAGIDFQASERETRKLISAHNLSMSMGGKLLFKGIDILLSPGTRLGIVGKNGTGKTTLLRILAQQLSPEKGTIKIAEGLKTVYFDQHREQIPLDISLKDALCPSGDNVIYQGINIHVHGWAKRFLFPQDRLSMPVRCLSGGERARILIARLMLQPADVLLLDEPTNDLDIPTLEILEQTLKEFKGALVIISHDRQLMKGLCSKILALSQGEQGQLFASYESWEKDYTDKKAKTKIEACAPFQPSSATNKKIKLSYHEQKELASMEDTIAQQEQHIANLEKIIEKEKDTQKLLLLYSELAQGQQHLEKLFYRWQELDDKTSSSGR